MNKKALPTLVVEISYTRGPHSVGMLRFENSEATEDQLWEDFRGGWAEDSMLSFGRVDSAAGQRHMIPARSIFDVTIKPKPELPGRTA
jgi:hypothetical protein